MFIFSCQSVATSLHSLQTQQDLKVTDLLCFMNYSILILSLYSETIYYSGQLFVFTLSIKPHWCCLAVGGNNGFHCWTSFTIKTFINTSIETSQAQTSEELSNSSFSIYILGMFQSHIVFCQIWLNTYMYTAICKQQICFILGHTLHSTFCLVVLLSVGFLNFASMLYTWVIWLSNLKQNVNMPTKFVKWWGIFWV